MKSYGRAAVCEFLGDRIVYRNLIPADPRLPPLEAISDRAGLPAGRIPRKNEPDYARVVVQQLQQARLLEAPATNLKRLIFVGDTRLGDGTAFTNLCQVAGWPGLAFIGSENSQPATVEAVPVAPQQSLYLANRWAALADFDRFCAAQGFPIDEATVVVLDLDKTTIGARGRNAHTIDQARVQAVQETVASLLGPAYDPAVFQAAYSRLDQPEFHPFTTDNQDYLAYTCLILGSGLYELGQFVSDIRSARLGSFAQFIDRVDARRDELPAALEAIHAEIYANVQAGDPTPFKPFRRNEYLATIRRMGCLEDPVPVETLLADEIVITQEVRHLALEWQARGALVFGLSDKPDEASKPTGEQAARGYAPIHRQSTHAVGS